MVIMRNTWIERAIMLLLLLLAGIQSVDQLGVARTLLGGQQRVVTSPSDRQLGLMAPIFQVRGQEFDVPEEDIVIENVEDLYNSMSDDGIVVDPEVVRHNNVVLDAIGKRNVEVANKYLLVSLANGYLVAIDEDTGKEVWRVDTGAPLVASSARYDGQGDEDKRTQLQLRKEGIFPGTDGTLYTYKMDENKSPRVQKLPVSVKDLVHSSPSPTPEGSLMLGSQQSVVFIIDLMRGIVLKTIRGNDEELYKYLSKPKQNEDVLFKSDLPTIVISRKDYIVRSIHPSLGEQWNVSWSYMDKMPQLKIHGHGDDSEEVNLDLLVAPDYSLKRIDRKNGDEIWSASFDAPAITAYPSKGKPIDVLSATTKLMSLAAKRNNARNAVSQNKGHDLEITETLVLGEMHGGLFGMRTPLFRNVEMCDSEDDPRNAEEVGTTPSGGSTAMVPVSGGPNAADSHGSCRDPNSGYCKVPVATVPTIEVDEDGSQTNLLFLPKCSADDEADCDDGQQLGAVAIVRQQWLVVGTTLVAGVLVTAIAFYFPNSRRKIGWLAKNDMSTFERNHEIGGNSITEDGKVKVGRLEVGDEILGYGSGGTVVYSGLLDGRHVAVKRMLKQFVDLAKQEITALIDSDEHPNVVRCFAMEEDAQFVYLALERCEMTLSDAVERSLDTNTDEGSIQFLTLDINGNYVPTERAMQIARDIAEGVSALHERGIVHRDLKPHNVLLNSQGRAKLSDMGLSKRVQDSQASFETLGAGGSPGWQAPEQLILRGGGNARQSGAVDVFSMGLLMHYCISGGKHPFGEGYDRDAAILKGKKSLDAVAHVPGAANILEAMLQMDPKSRPTIDQVLEHPVWWSAHQRLGFLVDVSDRVEIEDRATDDSVFFSLEAQTRYGLGGDGEWLDKLDESLVDNLGKYRKYDSKSLRDLLRVIRNKYNHYRELPPALQKKLGSIPDGFLSYFESKFPDLVISCFYFSLKWYPNEQVFKRYFNSSRAKGLLDAPCAPDTIRDPIVAEEAIKEARSRVSSQKEIMLSLLQKHQDHLLSVGTNEGTPSKSPGFRGDNRMVASAQGSPMMLPRRPWMVTCEYYAKMGTCKFGMDCKFDHPPEFQVTLNAFGLPIRDGQPRCAHFERTGTCKYGPSCKYDHRV